MQTPPAARFIGGVMGFVFGGIGLAVLIFLWSAPFGEFHSPPLIFRFFGSFIAIAFVAVGGLGLYGALTGKTSKGMQPAQFDQLSRQNSSSQQPAATMSPAGGYACPRCGAPLAEKAEVSPMGDTKCAHCGAWFNLHGRKP